jgi:ATP-dependent Clp protease ATP-binding subunit ClpA
MNAANILKPALSRGEIQLIGATTLAEYRKNIEKDSALERRFQPVMVTEPSVEDTVRILSGIKQYYEVYHSVRVDDEVIRQAVLLSERYITDRYLPDKAIDLLDEACSDVNLRNRELSELVMLENELSTLRAERENLLLTGDEGLYQRIADIKIRECRLGERIAELRSPEHVKALTVEDLARVIELWTSIPASKIAAQEFEKLSRLEERLKQRIVGQDEAITAVARAIRRNRVGGSPKRKPVSMIFAGPTGVGKTELVKTIAADLFDNPDALIRVDMSEYMEKHSVSRIIGSPPGYVGYAEAGQLTEKIRRRPYSVNLFHEIEKDPADPVYLRTVRGVGYRLLVSP